MSGDRIGLALSGAGHIKEGRTRAEHDGYATSPEAVLLLLENEPFKNLIWEPACGMGHISETLKGKGYTVRSTDIHNWGYPDMEREVDFLSVTAPRAVNSPDELFQTFWGDIITNPPYKYALEFAEHALDRVLINGSKLALLLRLTFLEGRKRRRLFDAHPLKTLYVPSKRLKCAKYGQFDKYGSAMMAFAWYVWEKGYEGETVVKWIN